jgi:hypothetical protein
LEREGLEWDGFETERLQREGVKRPFFVKVLPKKNVG